MELRKAQDPADDNVGKHTPTCGEVLSDGTMLEVLRDRVDHSQCLLLKWKDGRSSTGKAIQAANQHFFPLPNARRMIRHLPYKAIPYGSSYGLFNDIVQLIANFSGVSGEDSKLLAFFGLCSFFNDCVSMSPCVLLSGPSPAECMELLRLLSCICRHPVVLGNAGLDGIPEPLSATRLFSQCNSSVEKLLPALQFSGFGLSSSDGFRQISAASAIVADAAEMRTHFAKDCIWINVPPATRPFSIRDEFAEAQRIDDLQNRLLYYRLKNYPAVKSSIFDVPQFNGSVRQLARSLGACLVDAPRLQQCLIDVLRERDEADRVDRTGDLDSVVIEALIVCCHERRPSVYVGEVAELVNGILSRTEDRCKVSARQIGTILKRLRIGATKLSADGRGIMLLESKCRRIHQLAKAYGVATLRDGGLEACPYCREARAHDAHDAHDAVDPLVQ
jgi:hypothetical protein